MKRFYFYLIALSILSLTACKEDDDNSTGGSTNQPQDTPTSYIEILSGVTNKELVFDYQRGSKEIKINSSHTWRAEFESNQYWCKIDPTSGLSGENTINISVDEHTDISDDRKAKLTFTTANDKTVEIQIIQKTEDAITLSSNKKEIGTKGGSFDIEFQANIDNVQDINIAYDFGNNAAWIREAGITRGTMKNHTFSFEVDQNEGVSRREAKITFTAGNAQEDITIYQEGAEPSIVLSKSIYDITSKEQEVEIVVSSNIDDVNIVILEGSDWVSDVTSDASRAMDSHKFTLKVEENSKIDESGQEISELRTAIIKVTSKSISGLSSEIAINQSPTGVIALGYEYKSIGSEGGEIVIPIDHNVPFDVAIAEDAKGWISNVQNNTTRALTHDDYKIQISPNNTHRERIGEITFFSTDGSDITQTIKIHQNQDNYLGVIGKKEYIVTSSGETIEIKVEQNVNVTVEVPSDVNWVNQISTRALSTKTYYFEILPNDTHKQRTTEITFTNKENNLSESVSIIQSQKDDIVVAKDKYEIDSNGGKIDIEIGHNVDFDIEISDSWITNVTTRAFETETLTFNVAANSSNDSRDGTIKFISKDKSITQTVKIHQSQLNALIVSKKDIVIDEKAQPVEFEVSANVDYTVSDPDVSWLHRESTRAMTSQKIRYRVDVNSEYNSRTATITVQSKDGSLKETITITQAQKDAIVLTPNNLTVSNEGEDIEIEVGYNVDYRIEISHDWITQIDTRAWQEDVVAFRVAPYSGEDSRDATIKFISTDGSNITQTVAIHQTQKDALIISQKERSIDEKKQNVSFTVRHNVEYTVGRPSADWLRQVTTRALDEHDITFEVDANTSYNSRTATITVQSKDGSLKETITIIQAQKDAIVVAKDKYDVDGNSNTINIEVGRNIEFDVEISDNAKLWISRVVSRAFETETLTFQIAENPDYVERRGTITFTSTDNKISQTITVIQAGYDATEPRHNEIWYTSTNGNIVTPQYRNVFGANIVSNTYENGKGIITFDGDVTEIGYEAFAQCSSLTSITIPDSVTKIGNYAFQHCSLTSITIPDSVTEIGTQAFYCSSLKAFYGKFASEDNRCLIIDGVLNSFAPANLTSYTIPDSVTEIGYEAFAQCSRLTSITIPDSVITIGDSAFSSCSRLTSVTIPDSVTEIGYYAFAYCSNLASVYCKSTTPPAVTKTSNYNGWRAFDNNAPRRMIYVPAESVDAYRTADGWHEYANAISADKPANNEIWYTTSDGMSINKYLGESYPTNIFGGASIATHTYENGRGVIRFNRDVTMIGVQAFFNCSNLKSITIPESVTSIEKGAFNSCKSLTDIEIPETVTSIGSSVFASCTSLPAIIIPESITEIKERAFESCTSLTEITIPSQVTSVEPYAFDKCSNLKVVHCLPTEPPTAKRLYWYAFSNNASGRKIYVPATSVNRYKSADGWRDYASDILPEGGDEG